MQLQLQQQATFAAGSTITMVTAGSGNQMLVLHLDLSCKLFFIWHRVNLCSAGASTSTLPKCEVIFRQHLIDFFLIITLNIQESFNN